MPMEWELRFFCGALSLGRSICDVRQQRQPRHRAFLHRDAVCNGVNCTLIYKAWRVCVLPTNFLAKWPQNSGTMVARNAHPSRQIARNPFEVRCVFVYVRLYHTHSLVVNSAHSGTHVLHCFAQLRGCKSSKRSPNQSNEMFIR